MPFWLQAKPGHALFHDCRSRRDGGKRRRQDMFASSLRSSDGSLRLSTTGPCKFGVKSCSPAWPSLTRRSTTAPDMSYRTDITYTGTNIAIYYTLLSVVLIKLY